MSRSLSPDYLFAHYYEISPAFLKSIGVNTILSDIDNTLAPYEMPVPDERIISWVNELRQNGIKLALISNNSAERVEVFNASLGLPAYPDSKKPGKKRLLSALAELGAELDSCAVLGDQLFTDVWAARNLGVRAIVVPPIKDKKTFFFRFKRALERPIMKRYIRKRGYTSAE